MATVEDGMAFILAHPEHVKDCLLCKRRARSVGVFFPTDSRLYGAAPGKQRMIGYGLCRRCEKLPDRNARVEAHMLEQLYPTAGSA
jgi:hypothetical protein